MKAKVYSTIFILILLIITNYPQVTGKFAELLFSGKYKEKAVQACKLAYLRDYDELQHNYLGVVNGTTLLNIQQKIYFGFDNFKLPRYDKYDLEHDYRDEMCEIHSKKRIRSGVYTFDIGPWTNLIVFDKENDIKVQFDSDAFLKYLYTKNTKPIVKSKEKTLALAKKKATRAYNLGENYRSVRIYPKAIEFYLEAYEAVPSKQTAQKLVECYTKLKDAKNAKKWQKFQ